MRFPEFTEEWEKSKLGEIAKIIGGGTPDTIIDEYWNGDIQWFTPSEIKSHYVAKSDRKITKLGLSKSSAKLLPIGTILLTTRATIGEVAIATEECTTNQGFQSLIVNKNVNNIFISNWIKQNKKELIKRANGSTFVEISKSEIESIPILLPETLEQDKIAAFLSLIDERIETQNKIIEDLKKLKTALVDGLYASPSGSPRLRFQEFQKSWMQTNLGSITQNFNRRNKNKIVYPMFSVTNNSGFITQLEKFGDREMVGEDIGSYKIVNLGEFAYNPARINVGSIARYNGNESCMISSLYVCFRLKSDISSHWALYLLKSHRMNFYYNVYGEGGVRVYLFYPNFARIKVSVPELLEQEKIGAMLSTIDKRIDLERNLNDKYQQQKTFLLRQMFT